MKKNETAEDMTVLDEAEPVKKTRKRKTAAAAEGDEAKPARRRTKKETAAKEKAAAETPAEPAEKFTPVSRMKEVKGLDELKEEYRQIHARDGYVRQRDIMASLEHLSLDDSDMDELMDWFREEGIEVTEDEDNWMTWKVSTV